MKQIRKGDIVVLLTDNARNGVPDFEKFIGLAGEIYEEDTNSVFVAFGPEWMDEQWWYARHKLEIIGDVR